MQRVGGCKAARCTGPNTDLLASQWRARALAVHFGHAFLHEKWQDSGHRASATVNTTLALLRDPIRFAPGFRKTLHKPQKQRELSQT